MVLRGAPFRFHFDMTFVCIQLPLPLRCGLFDSTAGQLATAENGSNGVIIAAKYDALNYFFM